MIIGVAFTFPALTQSFLGQSSKSWCLTKTRDHEDFKNGIVCLSRPHNSGTTSLQSKTYFFLGHTVEESLKGLISLISCISVVPDIVILSSVSRRSSVVSLTNNNIKLHCQRMHTHKEESMEGGETSP